MGFDFFNQIIDLNDTVIQMCNLCEINASALKTKDGSLDKDKFYKVARHAAIAGTLQAGFNSFPYLGKQTEDIVAGEALLGVGITGWFDNPELFDAEILQTAAKIVVDTNIEVAAFLGINPAPRTTVVKPSGNASVILGTPSGIHADHSERGFRVMQLNKDSEVAKWLLNTYPEMLEESVWSQSKTDYVVFVPYENVGGIYKDSITDIQHLEYIKLVQENWVKAGTNRERAYNPVINHNVSNTVIVKDYDAVVDYIYNNQDSFVAVSFLSSFGDKDFNQSPFTSVLNEKELLDAYGIATIFASGLIVDGLHYYNNDLWTALKYVENPELKLHGTRDQYLLQIDWIRRVKKFAKNYLNNDIKKAIYCLKDVHLFHKWNVINRVFKKVPDFSKILTKPEYTSIDTMAAIACSGGACELPELIIK